MKTLLSTIISLGTVLGFLVACAPANRNVSTAPRSDDLLELLTGFGESLSKRNFNRAVDFMVPEEKEKMMEGGSVPAEKQKMLLALPLQKLIRHPSIRVENGHIAGIYGVLPNLTQGESVSLARDESASDGTGLDGSASSENNGPMGSDASNSSTDANEEMSAMQTPTPDANDPMLKSTINKFFSAVNNRNWSSALAMMSDGEKKMLLDDKGRLKESSKQRLVQMDQKSHEALILQDGKLTGVTLLLPSE